MSFSPPRFPYLREWPTETTAKWETLTTRAKKSVSRVGNGKNFEEVLAGAREVLASGSIEDLHSNLEDSQFCRAVFRVWHDDPQFARETLAFQALEAIRSVALPLTRLSALTLLRLHLTYFDEVDKWGKVTLEQTSELLRDALKEITRVQPGSALQFAIERPNLLLGRDSPARMSLFLREEGLTVPEFFLKNGLAGYENGRFSQQVREHYFLAQIREADSSQDHDFLQELTSTDVINRQSNDGRLFGHTVIEEMAANKKEKPSRQWVDTVLDIAGDPRVEGTDRWEKWWRDISSAAQREVITWLSTQDLRLFLTAVEQYAREANDAELLRMFPDRKIFLEGLDQLGIVRETRLFLGDNARSRVKSILGKHFRSDIAYLTKEPAKSLIFVDCGDFHFLEGSHNYRLWIYIGKPHPMLVNRRRREFDPANLWKIVSADQERVLGRKGFGFEGVTHHGLWQYAALKFLGSRGISLPADKLMSKASYDLMKYRLGLPPVRK